MGIVLYLLGFIRFPHDSPVKERRPCAGAFIALFAGIAVYLALGFRYDSKTKTFTEPKLVERTRAARRLQLDHPSKATVHDL